MQQQSKIKVLYQIASQEVVLGEILNSAKGDIVSLWRDFPSSLNQFPKQGYRLSLFDDDGKHIGDKSVSVDTADMILLETKVG